LGAKASSLTSAYTSSAPEVTGRSIADCGERVERSDRRECPIYVVINCLKVLTCPGIALSGSDAASYSSTTYPE
jgi:hypothetical protein